MNGLVKKSLVNFLRPLAGIFLNSGITWKVFSELSKAVFVEVATKRFGVHRRETNTSRVSMMTGIPRKQVAKLKKEGFSYDSESEDYGHIAGTLLSMWFKDEEYLDSDGNPLELRMKGDTPSFESLAKKYAADYSPQSIKKELIKAKCVEVTKDGLVKTINRVFMISPNLHALSALRDLSESLFHSIENPNDPRFTREATEDEIPEVYLPDFKKFIADKGMKFLEEVDDWLVEHKGLEGNEKGFRVGVGVNAIINNEDDPP